MFKTSFLIHHNAKHLHELQDIIISNQSGDLPVQIKGSDGCQRQCNELVHRPLLRDFLSNWNGTDFSNRLDLLNQAIIEEQHAL